MRQAPVGVIDAFHYLPFLLVLGRSNRAVRAKGFCSMRPRIHE